MRADNVIECRGALILGAGLAGLFTALKLSPYPATIIAGAQPGHSGSSAWAQGGIAAAVGEGDTWHAHARDTIAAGAGACDPAIAEMAAREAAARIDDLVAMGALFDRKVDGSLALGREAAHSAARIVHVTGDRAGAEVSRVLAERSSATSSITLCEGFHAVELALENGRVAGVFARFGSGADARLVLFRSNAVIFATGGIGALYAVTTNPMESRGEGLGMAARAGAEIADAEFVQFHPTAIAVGRDPAPLATEALRGDGAVLIDETGRRFMPTVHRDAELAPRDVVARALHREIAQGHRVFLDCRGTVGTRFAQAFPTVYAACMSAGIDPAAEPIPVSPAAHYHMGGIATDANGRSSLEGLWAVGECACTGLHGANRLASNSLLEALVFGARVAEDVCGIIRPQRAKSVSAPSAHFVAAMSPPPKRLREAMTGYLGLVRNEHGIVQALDVIGTMERASNGEPSLLNMAAAAKLVGVAGLQRRESRGAHFRSDYPHTLKSFARSVLTLADANRLVADVAPREPMSTNA